jgi:hypothetical protein
VLVAGAPTNKPAIDPGRMAALEKAAQLLAALIGDVISETREVGFLLMLFSTGDRPEMTYISNCERGDVLDMLHEYFSVLEQRLDAPPGVLTRPLH